MRASRPTWKVLEAQAQALALEQARTQSLASASRRPTPLEQAALNGMLALCKAPPAVQCQQSVSELRAWDDHVLGEAEQRSAALRLLELRGAELAASATRVAVADRAVGDKVRDAGLLLLLFAAGENETLCG